MRNQLTLFFLLFVGFLSAQSYPYKLYTSEDGLLQNQVKCTYQDRSGYLWIGGNTGICRFDGKTFEPFLDEEAPSDFVSCITEDAFGNVWASDQIGLYKFNGVRFTKEHEYTNVEEMVFDREGQLWVLSCKTGICEQNLSVFKITGNGLAKISIPFLDSLNQALIPTIHYDEEFDRMLIGTGSAGLFEYKSKQLSKIDARQKIKYITTTSKGETYFIADSSQYQLNNLSSKKIKSFGHALKIKVGINKVGEVYYTQLRDRFTTLYKEGAAVTIDMPVRGNYDLKIDREDNIWLATDVGLLVVYRSPFINYSKTDSFPKKIWSILEDRDSVIWMASYDEGLFTYDGKQIVNQENKYSELKGGLSFYMGGIKDQYGNLLFPTNNQILKYDGEDFNVVKGSPTSLYKNEINNRGAVLFLYEDTTANHLLVCRRGLQILNEQGEVAFFDVSKFNTKGHLTSVNKIDKGQYWVTHHNGVSKVDVETETVTNYNNKDTTGYFFPANGAYCTFKDFKGNWWFGSKNGLLFYESTRDYFQLVGEESIGAKDIGWFTASDDDFLIMCLDKGIAIFDLNQFYATKEERFRVLKKEDGFLGIEGTMNAVLKASNGDIWIPCTHVTSKLSYEQVNAMKEKTFKPMVKSLTYPAIDNAMNWKVLMNQNQNGSSKEEIHLSDKIKDIRFDYQSISFTAKDFVYYQYRLLGPNNETEWSEPTKETFAMYSNLKRGGHTFQVKLANEESDESIATFEFEIIKNWKPIIMWGLGLVALLAIFFAIFRELQNRTKNRELKTALELSKLKALQAQMKPHFIFNVINAIQTHIFSGDKRQANVQIQKLSVLIRSYLEGSKADTISLSKEIELLELYIEFEQSRFSDFECNIDVADDVSLDIAIAPMIFQPFVENAINHGLLYLPPSRKGKLDISIKQEGELLICIIQDNGIGRKQSKLLKEKSIRTHIPRGTQIVEERINILSALKKKSIQINTTDVLDDDKEIVGTKVTIQIKL